MARGTAGIGECPACLELKSFMGQLAEKAGGRVQNRGRQNLKSWFWFGVFLFAGRQKKNNWAETCPLCLHAACELFGFFQEKRGTGIKRTADSYIWREGWYSWLTDIWVWDREWTYV